MTAQDLLQAIVQAMDDRVTPVMECFYQLDNRLGALESLLRRTMPEPAPSPYMPDINTPEASGEQTAALSAAPEGSGKGTEDTRAPALPPVPSEEGKEGENDASGALEASREGGESAAENAPDQSAEDGADAAGAGNDEGETFPEDSTDSAGRLDDAWDDTWDDAWGTAWDDALTEARLAEILDRLESMEARFNGIEREMRYIGLLP